METTQHRAYVREMGECLGRPVIEVAGKLLVASDDGIQWSATPSGSREDPFTTFVCDVCPVGTARRLEFLERALSINALAHGPWSPVYAWDRSSDNLLLMLTLPIDAVPAASAAKLLVRMGTLVASWRVECEAEADEETS